MKSTKLASIVSTLNAYTSSRANEDSPKDTIFIQARGDSGVMVTSDGEASIAVKNIEMSGQGSLFIKSRPFIQASKVVKGEIRLSVSPEGLSLESDKGGKALIPASEAVTILGGANKPWERVVDIEDGNRFALMSAGFCGEYAPYDVLSFTEHGFIVTNNFRIACNDIISPVPFSLERAIIPGLKKVKGPLYIEHQDGRVRISSGDIQVYAKAIYKRGLSVDVLSAPSEEWLEIETKPFIDAIKGVADHDEYKRFRLITNKDTIDIVSYSDNLNKISIRGIIYAEGKMSFLSSNIIDSLKSLDTKTIRLHWSDETKTFITSKEAPQWRIIIAPVR